MCLLPACLPHSLVGKLSQPNSALPFGVQEVGWRVPGLTSLLACFMLLMKSPPHKTPEGIHPMLFHLSYAQRSSLEITKSTPTRQEIPRILGFFVPETRGEAQT